MLKSDILIAWLYTAMPIIHNPRCPGLFTSTLTQQQSTITTVRWRFSKHVIISMLSRELTAVNGRIAGYASSVYTSHQQSWNPKTTSNTSPPKSHGNFTFRLYRKTLCRKVASLPKMTLFLQFSMKTGSKVSLGSFGVSTGLHPSPLGRPGLNQTATECNQEHSMEWHPSLVPENVIASAL